MATLQTDPITAQDALQFLKKNNVFYVAVSQNGAPALHAARFVMQQGGTLLFCAPGNSALYTALQQNQSVEMMSTNAGGDVLRLQGDAIFCTDDDTTRQALQAAPWLQQLFSPGELHFYRLQNATLTQSTWLADETQLFPYPLHYRPRLFNPLVTPTA